MPPSYCAINQTTLLALRVAMASHALSGNIEAAQKLWRQVAQLSPSDRMSETR